MIAEDIVDDIGCMQWGVDEGWEEQRSCYLDIIFKNFGSRPVPSLFHICVHQIHLNYPQHIPTIGSLRA